MVPMSQSTERYTAKQKAEMQFNPSLHKMHFRLLVWDVINEQTIHNDRRSSSNIYRQIPTSFESYNDYFEFFEPLFYLEIKQNLKQSYIELLDNSCSRSASSNKNRYVCICMYKYKYICACVCVCACVCACVCVSVCALIYIYEIK